MLEIIFKSIPKTSNEIVFVLGLLGLYILLVKKKKKIYAYLVFFILLGMIIWRMFYKIDSGRYASCLIYPFSILAAFFLSCIIKFKNVFFTLSAIILGIALVSNFTYKNYSARQIDSNLEVVTQLHNRLNKKNANWALITHEDDFYRFMQFDKNDNPIGINNKIKTMQDVSTFIKNYKGLSKKILLNITLSSKTNSNIDLQVNKSEYRHVLSVFIQRNQRKRTHVYTVEPSADLLTLSQNKSIEPESGILKNGDLELLDSPQESFKKFKNHIGRYSLFFDCDESKRTPINAYFHNDSKYTEYLPFYSCLNDNAISGNNSARIAIKNGFGYLLFYQRFTTGTYQYSVTFSGEKGTLLCVLYDLYANKKWNVIPLATYRISNKSIFQIKSSFSVSGLNEGEYFLVGVRVNGEAYLDNFSLKRINEDESLSSIHQ